MYLIVGLGNPEPEYSKTRHNMGFNTINKIAQQYNIEINRSKFQGLYESAIIEGQKVILVDHNEINQSIDGLEEAEVLEVIDHHKLDAFKTSSPISEQITYAPTVLAFVSNK